MGKANFLIQLDEVKFKGNELQVSKANAEGVARTLYNQIMNGNTTAITVAEMFKFFDEVAGQVKSMTDENGKNSFVDLVRGEILANSDDGKKCTSKYGTTLELAETNVKYTFDKCGDPLWEYYVEEIEKLEKKKKARENFLKTIEQSYPAGNILNPHTGVLHENVEFHPPIKTSNSSYKQTLIKE